MPVGFLQMHQWMGGSANCQSLQVCRAEIPDERQVKVLPFCFLQTDNVAIALSNIISNRVPFFIRVYSSDVLAKHFLGSL